MTKLLRQRWGLSRPPDVPFTLNHHSSQAVGLVAWWPTLASRGASTLRNFISESHATLYNTAQIQPAPMVGASLWLDGNSDYAQSAFPGILGANHRSCSVWIKTSTGADQVMIQWGDYDGANGERWTWRLDESAGGGDWVQRIEDVNGYVRGSKHVADGAWHLLEAQLASNDIANTVLFVDGVPDTIAASTAQVINTQPDDNVWVGRNSYATEARYFNGELADPRVWNRARGAAAAAQLYDPVTRWELSRPLLRQWQLKAPTAPPTGQPIHLRALTIPHMRQWQPRVAS